MQMRSLMVMVMVMVMVPLLACYDFKRAVVIPGRSAVADECFARCKHSGGPDAAVLSCVSAWCPGAQVADEACGDRIGCVEARHMNTRATLFTVIGIPLLGGLVFLGGVLILVLSPQPT